MTAPRSSRARYTGGGGVPLAEQGLPALAEWEAEEAAAKAYEAAHPICYCREDRSGELHPPTVGCPIHGGAE